jgi:hypothetical protein
MSFISDGVKVSQINFITVLKCYDILWIPSRHIPNNLAMFTETYWLSKCTQFVANLNNFEVNEFCNFFVWISTKILSALLEFVHVCTHLNDSFSRGFTVIQWRKRSYTKYIYAIFQLYYVNTRVSVLLKSFRKENNDLVKFSVSPCILIH